MDKLRLALASEDVLSEEIGIKLIEELGDNVEVGQLFRKDGNGYLRKRIRNFFEFSERVGPVILLTDLDNQYCPGKLIEGWVGKAPLPDRMIFRVVVKEIESWLLADHEAAKALLEKGARNLPEDLDSISDPKRLLLNLAKSAPRNVQYDLLPATGVKAARGLGYNSRLVELVRTQWSAERASRHSRSLFKARVRIREVVASISKNN